MLALITILGATVVTVALYATRPEPNVVNRILRPSYRDLSFIGTEIVEREATLVWTVSPPWSKDGLGGADRYLGEITMGVPVAASCPGLTCMAPGPTIVIDDSARVRVFDLSGEQLLTIGGALFGVLADGSMAIYGGGIALYDTSGAEIWRHNSVPTAISLLKLGEKDRAGEVRVEHSTYFTSDTEVFYTAVVSIGTYKTVPSYWHPSGFQQQWETLQEMNVCLAYDREGNTRLVETLPGRTFTPWGTNFGGAVQTEDGWAHREYVFDGTKLHLRRTLYLPSYALRGVGRDGTIVGRDHHYTTVKGLPHFTVYNPITKRAVGFVLPTMAIDFDYDNHLYTAETTEEAYVITCWEWPTP